jgi:hypothetical protein
MPKKECYIPIPETRKHYQTIRKLWHNRSPLNPFWYNTPLNDYTVETFSICSIAQKYIFKTLPS